MWCDFCPRPAVAAVPADPPVYLCRAHAAARLRARRQRSRLLSDADLMAAAYELDPRSGLPQLSEPETFPAAVAADRNS